MDIKLKSSSNLKNMRVVWLILTVMAIVMMSLYPMVLSRMEKQEQEKLRVSEDQMDVFMDMLYSGSIVLYWDYVNSYSEEVTPSDLYFEKASQETAEVGEGEYAADGAFYDSASEEISFTVDPGLIDFYDAERFDDTVKAIYHNFLRESVPSYGLEYKIYDSQGQGLGNSVNDLTQLEEGDSGVKAKYPFYVVLRYDETGTPSVSAFAGVEEGYLNRFISEAQDQNRLISMMDDSPSYADYARKSRGPENVTLVYASARENFFMSKANENYIMHSAEYRFGQAGFHVILTLALLVIVMIGIGLPFVTANMQQLRISDRVPMEAVAVGIVVLLALYGPLDSMAYYTASGSLFSSFLGRAPSTLQNFADYLFNFSVWILYFGTALILTLAIHPMFRDGLTSYLRQHSYSGKALIQWARRTGQFVMQLRQVDLKDAADRKLLSLLGINFVVLSVLCCAWVAGIFGLVLYTVVLFLIIRRQYEKIRADYCGLLDGVQAMADGNLEVKMPDDLGVFNSIKDELLAIQSGFKKAVEEEIKSQRMRSELITNVSHDLKTPLTSIITYTNLLKEEGITEEQRKTYIDTLDKKSQRLKRLIEDLFVISKATSNNIVLNPVNLDLAALIKQVMFELDDRVQSSGIEFRCAFHPDKLLVYLDCEKTYRIFENLVVNILKYSMPRSRAYITAEKIQDEIWVTLKNTSEQELTFQSDEITERFVRGDQSRNTEGSGLGLAIAKSFTTIQGGTFDIVLDGDLFKVILKWKANDGKL